MIDTRVLKYFLAVADCGNITRAAEKVFTTQSNISRQLAELETQLGKQLFVRGSRKIALTSEGEFFKTRSREILQLLERTESDVKNFTVTREIAGCVHIGAVESNIIEKFAKPMLELQKSHPKITYNFFNGSVAEIAEKLDKNLLDFAIMIPPIDAEKFDYLVLPFKNKFGLLMNKNSPLAMKKRVRSRDLKGVPVWLAHQQIESNILNGWLGDAAGTLNVVANFNLITNPAKLVAAGFGSAFTFENLVCSDELCFRPLSPKVETNFFLAWKKSPNFTPPAQLFLEKIKNLK